MKRLAFVLLLAVHVEALHAQAPTASIRGLVVRWGTVEPIEHATIELRSADGTAAGQVTATNDTGQFTFSNVPPGKYRIVAMRNGFAPAEYGQRRADGTGRSIVLAAGQQENLELAMSPASTISGRITGRDGQPLGLATVEVWRPQYDADGQLKPFLFQSTHTNDLGEFRIFGLPPSRYYVRALPLTTVNFGGTDLVNPMSAETNAFRNYPTTFISNRTTARMRPPVEENATYLPVYYPGSADIQGAQLVDAQEGREATGININVAPLTMPKVKLRGTVQFATGNSFRVEIVSWPRPKATEFSTVGNVTTIVPVAGTGNTAPRLQYVQDPTQFEGSVVQGTYQVRATAGDRAGRVIIDVRDKDVDVSIPLYPPAVLTGRIRTDGAVDLRGLQLGIRRIGSTPLLTSPNGDGQFRFDKVLPGDYRLFLASSPEQTAIRSIRLEGNDISDEILRIEGGVEIPPLDVFVAATAGSAEGRVVNAGRQIADATVVLVPQEARVTQVDLYRVVRSDSAGTFKLPGLPPGEYRLYAWEDVESNAWFDTTFLRAYDREATVVRIEEGQKKVIDVPLIPAGR